MKLLTYIEDLRIFARRLQPTNLRLENDLMLMRQNMAALSKEVPFMITESLRRAMKREPGYDAALSHFSLTIYTPITELDLWVANGPSFLKVQHHHWLQIADDDRESLFSDIESILGVSLPYGGSESEGRHNSVPVHELA